MWLVLAGVAGVLVLLLSVILATPFEMELSAAKAADDPAVRVQVRVRWLGFRLHSPRRRADRESAKKSAKARRRQMSIAGSTLTSVLASPGFMGRFVQLVTEELRRTRPRRFHLHARLGFEDPSDTGMFLAWIFALRGWRESPAVTIRLEPDFREEVVEGELSVVWSRSAGSMLWPLVKFVTSPTVFHAARAARRVAGGPR